MGSKSEIIFCPPSSHLRRKSLHSWSIIYVDEIIIMGMIQLKMKALKDLFTKQFEIKDLGFLSYFHRIEVTRSRKDIIVSQKIK